MDVVAKRTELVQQLTTTQQRLQQAQNVVEALRAEVNRLVGNVQMLDELHPPTNGAIPTTSADPDPMSMTERCG